MFDQGSVLAIIFLIYVCIIFPSFFIRLASFILIINDSFEVSSTYQVSVVMFFFVPISCVIAIIFFIGERHDLNQ